jgi:hypothetical protein
MAFMDEFDGEKRYREDIEFRTLVDTMEMLIVNCRFTPTELRQGAILAAIRYEQRQPRVYNTVDGVIMPRSLYR